MIIACLSWYDEDPTMLLENVASWGKLCDGVVALDGAYVGFADDQPCWSPSDQRKAIVKGGKEGGMFVWTGVAPLSTETGKRSMLMTAGVVKAGWRNWLVVVDADEQMVRCSRETLDAMDRDVGLVETQADDGSPMEQRRVFRALPGLRVEGHHYRYVQGGRTLWTHPGLPQEPAGTTGIKLRHRRGERSLERQARVDRFYRQRQENYSQP